MSDDRVAIELWRYVLGRNLTQIAEFVNNETNFDVKPLFVANLSTHFAKHTSQEGFWEEHPQLKWIKEKYEKEATENVETML